MNKGFTRPKWWLLYLCAAGILGLMWFEAKEPYSQTNHTLVEAGLVILLFGLSMVWLNAIEGAILSADCENKRFAATGEAEATRQDIQAREPGSNGNKQSSSEKSGESPMLPVWVSTLAGIVLQFFKTQER